MSRAHRLVLAALFVCALEPASGSPAASDTEPSNVIVCPKVVTSGSPAFITEVLTRIADKAEALARLRLEHKALGSEIYLLMRIEVNSHTGIRNADTLSHSPSDPTVIETSYNELAAHTAFASKVVGGFLHGDPNFAIKRTEDSSATGMLKDLYCEIGVLSNGVNELGDHLSH